MPSKHVARATQRWPCAGGTWAELAGRGQRGDSLTCCCTAGELFPDGGQQQLFPNRGLKREDDRQTRRTHTVRGHAARPVTTLQPLPHHLPATPAAWWGQGPPGAHGGRLMNSSPRWTRVVKVPEQPRAGEWQGQARLPRGSPLPDGKRRHLRATAKSFSSFLACDKVHQRSPRERTLMDSPPSPKPRHTQGSILSAQNVGAEQGYV